VNSIRSRLFRRTTRPTNLHAVGTTITPTSVGCVNVPVPVRSKLCVCSESQKRNGLSQFLLIVKLLACGLLAAWPAVLHAQSLRFLGSQKAIAAIGVAAPEGVAVDGAGDLFIADTGNNRVIEVPASGGAPIAVGSGLNRPVAVVVDSAGDVFIADSGNNRVVEVAARRSVQVIVPTIGLTAPGGLAVDGAGDVFIADTGNNRVVKVPAGGGSQITVPSTGLSVPKGLAVDAAGDVFIADTGNNRIVEELAHISHR